MKLAVRYKNAEKSLEATCHLAGHWSRVASRMGTLELRILGMGDEMRSHPEFPKFPNSGHPLYVGLQFETTPDF